MLRKKHEGAFEGICSAGIKIIDGPGDVRQRGESVKGVLVKDSRFVIVSCSKSQRIGHLAVKIEKLTDEDVAARKNVEERIEVVRVSAQ